jgi:hypothetical protein
MCFKNNRNREPITLFKTRLEGQFQIKGSEDYVLHLEESFIFWTIHRTTLNDGQSPKT